MPPFERDDNELVPGTTAWRNKVWKEHNPRHQEYSHSPETKSTLLKEINGYKGNWAKTATNSTRQDVILGAIAIAYAGVGYFIWMTVSGFFNKAIFAGLLLTGFITLVGLARDNKKDRFTDLAESEQRFFDKLAKIVDGKIAQHEKRFASKEVNYKSTLTERIKADELKFAGLFWQTFWKDYESIRSVVEAEVRTFNQEAEETLENVKKAMENTKYETRIYIDHSSQGQSQPALDYDFQGFLGVQLKLYRGTGALLESVIDIEDGNATLLLSKDVGSKGTFVDYEAEDGKTYNYYVFLTHPVMIERSEIREKDLKINLPVNTIDIGSDEYNPKFLYAVPEKITETVAHGFLSERITVPKHRDLIERNKYATEATVTKAKRIEVEEELKGISKGSKIERLIDKEIQIVRDAENTSRALIDASQRIMADPTLTDEQKEILIDRLTKFDGQV